MSQDLYADSQTPFAAQIEQRGRDLGGGILRGQIRNNPNQLSAIQPLAEFTFSPFVVTTENGEPVSRCKAALDLGTVRTIADAAGMGVSTEPGANVPLWYDIHLDYPLADIAVFASGRFILTPGVTIEP